MLVTIDSRASIQSSYESATGFLLTGAIVKFGAARVCLPASGVFKSRIMDERDLNVEKLRQSNEAAKKLKRDFDRQNEELAKLLQKAESLRLNSSKQKSKR